ncbi:unnamed protein product [Didymodactylos carnosus]|uniref:Uncharacterized protein n=1 Tax=Didymodactylos carnosus TaxID=1234261 RepID=A0A813SME0_9BILA|nr:unnamed protein product [Didymodactylos carnosus]CAF0796518.1 unnamed protein product [Didymodactylos carnosus]CAF3517122.1 unnamed protein product [Didymodactylos carnosus]CAF3581178.1 unnamed protein product [Didymodactylos carnosus]
MAESLQNSDVLSRECEKLNLLVTSIKKHIEESVASAANDLNEWKQLKANLSMTKVRGKVLLDVGGKEFATTVDTLTSEKNTFFTAMFSGQWELERDERGRIFIDRNGDLFAEILEYMRNPRKYVVSDERLRQRLINEAEFYQLRTLLEILTEPERKAEEERQKDKFEGTTLLNGEQQMKLNEFYGKNDQRWQLLYKATKDGFDAAAFHRLCNNQGATMTIVRSTGGYLFGAFASRSWTSAGKFTNAPNSFLYLLTNPVGSQPTKFPCKSNGHDLHHNGNYGPTFGGNHDLHISSGSNANNASFGNIGHSYLDTLGFGCNTFTGAYNFQTTDIEVFKLTQQ